MRIMVMLLVVMVLGSGCTAYKVARHNDKVQVARQIISISPPSQGMGMAVGIDLTQISKLQEGYFGAWRDDVGGMISAHLADAIVVGGGAYLYERGRKAKTTVSEVEQPATYEIHADTVIINRDGQVNYTAVGE